MKPVQLFESWYDEELQLTTANVPSACCLSTIGLDGYPNARFVSLKEVVDESFVVTGPLSSRKGLEIDYTNKVALTFWWTVTERQVRIQGDATKISGTLADKYFGDRGIESQIVSFVSDQGKEMISIDVLNDKYENALAMFMHKPVIRPANWGGYFITPVRIEFLEFKSTRFHDRKLFEWVNEAWTMTQLQP